MSSTDVVLVLDDEPQILTGIQDLLEDDFRVSGTTNAEHALKRLEEGDVAVVASDQRMPGLSGDEFLGKAKAISQATRVLITGYTDMDALIRAVNNGKIYSYVAKPWDPANLRITIAKAAEHYHLQDELARERDLLRSLMDNVPDSIYFKDDSLRFTRLNQSHAELLGVSAPQEAIGKTASHFFPTEYARRVRAEEQEMMKSWTAIKDRVEQFPSRDESPRWYSTTKVPIIGPDERVTGLVGISRDVTERKLAEEALARQAQQLARYNAELEQLAHVSAHDLQEPLRTVVSFTQLLGQRYRGKLDAEADKYIDVAVSAAQRMRSLIHDLQAYSGIARRPSDFRVTDCEAVFQQAADALRLVIDESGAIVTHDPLPTLTSDPSRLRQVFQHLVDNALKFRGQDAPRVHVSAQQSGEEWVFSVRDNGIGIDPRYADCIFEIFERLHAKHEYGGTGIGLAICKRIVESHQGRIWVESKPGKGATFYFRIPAG